MKNISIIKKNTYILSYIFFSSFIIFIIIAYFIKVNINIIDRFKPIFN